MDIQKIGIIALVKAAVTGESQALPDGFSLEDALGLARAHQITGMLYYGAVNCGIDQTLPVIQSLFATVCKCIAVCQKQSHTVDSVCAAFGEKGIDYMPLKGTLLRKMYPHGEMRLMGDADILIKQAQYDHIRPIMLALGFEERVESDHELVWKKAGFVIELHKRLIPSYNKDYFAYYGDGWKLAVPSVDMPHRYEMSAEDQMIYLFTHFAKHYRCGGIGIRHITDLYVYRKNAGELNETYIQTELKKLKLSDFYSNILQTIDVWFNNAPASEKTDIITETIFASGAFGTSANRKMAEALILKKGDTSTENAKRERMLSLLFPSLKNMTLHYHFLEKAPVLLPITWVLRLFKIVFFKRKKAKVYYAKMKNISTEDLYNYNDRLNLVGLNFDFEE